MCSISGCDKKLYAKTWCNTHYARWRRTGSVDLVKKEGAQATPCETSGCEGDSIARGWCGKHYQRWVNNGDPLKSQLRREGSLRERFESIVSVTSTDKCIEWPGRVDVNGYGRLKHDKVSEGAHRASYRLHIGPIPEGFIIRHKCDNPPCVNPAHLETGTHLDNARDRDSRSRGAHGERAWNAKLTEDAVREIRTSRGKITYSELAKKFDVTKEAVYAAATGRTWRNV